jgi:DMSO/TMAO reductase YedYZ molybdopterin-dependent catalytic subunit
MIFPQKKGRKMAIKDSKKWLMITALLLGAVLTMSCSPLIGSNNQDTGKTDQAGLVTSEPSQEPAQIEPPPSTVTEEPEADLPTELSQVISSDPAKVDNSKLPITSVDELNLTGTAPEVDIEQYRLVIDGLVETPLSLTYDEILAYPSVTEVVLLICPGYFADNAEWTGVPVTTLLEEAGIKPEAKMVVFQDIAGSYRKELLLEDVMGNDSIFLAYAVDGGQTLPAEHGYPLRLVAKDKYGSYWVKWVGTIEVK